MRNGLNYFSMNKYEIFEAVTVGKLKDLSVRDAVKALADLGVTLGKDAISRYRKHHAETGVNLFENTDTDTDGLEDTELQALNLCELYGIDNEAIENLQDEILACKGGVNIAINERLLSLWARMYLAVESGIDAHLQGQTRLPTEHFKMLRELSNLIRTTANG